MFIIILYAHKIITTASPSHRTNVNRWSFIHEGTSYYIMQRRSNHFLWEQKKKNKILAEERQNI